MAKELIFGILYTLFIFVGTLCLKLFASDTVYLIGLLLGFLLSIVLLILYYKKFGTFSRFSNKNDTK